MPRTNYLQQHFWCKEPIPFFKLFDNPEAKSIILVSCFNKSNVNFKVFGDNKKWIYYSGERFLTENNSDYIISFIPDSEQLKILQQDIETQQSKIYQIDMASGKYTYNYSNQQLIPISQIDLTKQQFIQLRDHERFYIELLAKSRNITSITTDFIAELSLYNTLESNWYNYGNNLVSENKVNLLNKKPKFACFIVSNPQCWQRNKLFDMLRIITGKKVDSLGKWKKNVDIIIPDRELANDEYISLISQYRFMITCENHSLPWYNTEKIYNAFMAGTVPIYWGDPKIEQFYNPDCFINIRPHENKQQQINSIITACERVKSIENEIASGDYSSYQAFFKNNLMVDSKNMDDILKRNMNTIFNIFHDKK